MKNGCLWRATQGVFSCRFSIASPYFPAVLLSTFGFFFIHTHSNHPKFNVNRNKISFFSKALHSDLALSFSPLIVFSIKYLRSIFFKSTICLSNLDELIEIPFCFENISGHLSFAFLTRFSS